MPFPASERLIFERNPLAQVICQLRFPPILAIAAREPAEFQDAIRQEYPAYRKDQGPGALPEELARLLSSFGMSAPSQSIAHTFESEDSRKVIGLTPEFVAVTDNRYKTWDEFSAEIQRAKNAVEAVYHPSFYARIGLRYVNVIDKEELGLHGVAWPELLKPPFLGVLGTPEVGGQVTQIGTDALITIPEVPDASLRLRHGLQRKDDKETYRFDADFFVGERRGADDVLPILVQFNRLTGNFFRWAITPTLREALLQPMAPAGQQLGAAGAG